MKSIFKVLIIMTALVMTLGLSAPVEAFCTGTVTLTSPTGGEVWSGTHSVTWDTTDLNCTDSELLDIVLYDGGSVQSPVGVIDSPDVTLGTYSWNTANWYDINGTLYQIPADDDYKIYIRLASQHTTQDHSPTDFTIDNTVPTISNTDSSDDWYMNGDVVWADFDAYDEVAGSDTLDVPAFVVTVGGQNMTYEPAGTTCAAEGGDGMYCYTRTLNTDETEGSAVVSINVTDTAGNVVQNTDETINTDFTNPTTPIIDDPTDLTLNQDDIRIWLDNASTDDNFRTYQTSTDGVAFVDTTEDYTTGFYLPLTQDADNIFCIRGKDLARNEGTADCVTIREDSVVPDHVTGLNAYDSPTPYTITVDWDVITDPTLSSGIDHYELFARKLTAEYPTCFDNITEPDVETIDDDIDFGINTYEVSSVGAYDVHYYRDYCFAVIAIDNADNARTGVTTDIGTAYPNEEIELDDDWNFISSPVVVADTNIVNVFDDIDDDVIIVWYYNAATSTWMSYIPGTGGTLTTFEDGRGYWVDMSDPATLELEGTYFTVASDLPEYNVYVGWNAIGYTKSGASTTASTENYFMSLGYTPLTLVHVPTGNYTGFPSTSNMNEGEGHWVSINADDVLRPGADTTI